MLLAQKCVSKSCVLIVDVTTSRLSLYCIESGAEKMGVHSM